MPFSLEEQGKRETTDRYTVRRREKEKEKERLDDLAVYSHHWLLGSSPSLLLLPVTVDAEFTAQCMWMYVCVCV